jgi:hypothetical protein
LLCAEEDRDSTQYSFLEGTSRVISRSLSEDYKSVRRRSRSNRHDQQQHVRLRSFESGIDVAYCLDEVAVDEAGAGFPQLPIYSAAFNANFDYVR